MAVSEDFARLSDPFRPELLAYCYRMLGSVHDAEDQVQETLIRAWQSYGDFEGRASLRTWLYRIATNACLRALENSGRRPLPPGLGGPDEYPEASLAAPRPEVPWLQPIPDALVSAGFADPAEIVASRQRMRIALIAALQYLPPRQRAVLILRDVLRWRSAEVADLLGTTTIAVNGTLHRARARLEQAAPEEDLHTSATAMATMGHTRYACSPSPGRVSHVPPSSRILAYSRRSACRRPSLLPCPRCRADDPPSACRCRVGCDARGPLPQLLIRGSRGRAMCCGRAAAAKEMLRV